MNNPRHPHILYTFRRCPYAMRARMGLFYAKIDVEVREIILRDKPAHMLQISPKGTVPVLFLHDGTVIDESLDILKWAVGQNDPDGWLNDDNKIINELITQNDGSFKHALDRYKYPNRYPDEDCSNKREEGLGILEDLNDRIQRNGYLIKGSISLADIAIFPFVRQFAHVDRDWFYALPLKPLHTWLTNHLESDLFKSVMTKYDQWHPDNTPIKLF